MSLDRPKPTQLHHWICNTSTCSFFQHVIFDKVLVNGVHNVRLKCIFVVVFGFVLFLVILFTIYSLYRKQQWSTNVDTAFRSSKFNIKLKNCHSFLAVAFFRSLLKLSNSAYNRKLIMSNILLIPLSVLLTLTAQLDRYNFNFVLYKLLVSSY